MSNDDTSKYYKTILESISSKDYSKSNAYEDLLKVEKNVLDTINRVAEYEEKKKENYSFYEKSIYDIITIFANTWVNIFNEIFVEKQYRTLKEIIFKNDRKIYVGLMFIIIAFFLFLYIIS